MICLHVKLRVVLRLSCAHYWSWLVLVCIPGPPPVGCEIFIQDSVPSLPGLNGNGTQA